MILVQMAIARKKKKQPKGLCNNLLCGAPLEPPFNKHIFQVEGCDKVFTRIFCVECYDTISSTDPSRIQIEVR